MNYDEIDQYVDQLYRKQKPQERPALPAIDYSAERSARPIEVRSGFIAWLLGLLGVAL